jgi:hypothetical protein
MATLELLSGQVLRTTAGAAYAGAKASFWSDAGASVPLAVYTDAGLSSAHPQPVVADGTTGTFPAIYLSARRYWRTVTTSAGVSLSQFNIGPIDAGVTLVTSATAPSPTYPVSLYWYDTTTGHLKRRNAADSAWLDLGTIDGLLNAATVTQQLTGTDATVSSTPDSVAALWQRGTDIASAATLSLPATGGGVYNVTGTTGISGISSAQGGRTVMFKFAGACTITHNGTSMILPGAANLTTAAGDVLTFTNEAAQDASGSNWRCSSYILASGGPILLGTALTATQADQETGTSTTKAVTPGRQHFHPSASKAWAYVTVPGGVPQLDANYNITSVADTAVGRMTITIATDFSSALWSPSCTVEQAAAGTELIPNVRTSTIAAGTIELTASTVGGADTDPGSYGFQGFGDFA